MKQQLKEKAFWDDCRNGIKESVYSKEDVEQFLDDIKKEISKVYARGTKLTAIRVNEIIDSNSGLGK